MKELKRLLIYGVSTAVVILILYTLATSGAVSGDLLLLVATLLVVVLPVALIIWVGKRERARRQSQDGETS